jgi:hypothetical protein
VKSLHVCLPFQVEQGIVTLPDDEKLLGEGHAEFSRRLIMGGDLLNCHVQLQLAEAETR